MENIQVIHRAAPKKLIDFQLTMTHKRFNKLPLVAVSIKIPDSR